jgi:hypothetical protein
MKRKRLAIFSPNLSWISCTLVWSRLTNGCEIKRSSSKRGMRRKYVLSFSKGILLNLARGLAFLLTFLVPCIALYFLVLYPQATFGNLTPYDLDNSIVSLHFFISPLLFMPFFLIFSSYFSLVRTFIISYAGIFVSLPIVLILLGLFGHGLSAGPTPISTTVFYFAPNAIVFALAFLFGRRKQIDSFQTGQLIPSEEGRKGQSFNQLVEETEQFVTYFG